MFWFVGLIPDFATLARYRANSKVFRVIYGMLSMGLARFQRGTGIATKWPICCWPELATPLVLSVAHDC